MPPYSLPSRPRLPPPPLPLPFLTTLLRPFARTATAARCTRLACPTLISRDVGSLDICACHNLPPLPRPPYACRTDGCVNFCRFTLPASATHGPYHRFAALLQRLYGSTACVAVLPLYPADVIPLTPYTPARLLPTVPRVNDSAFSLARSRRKLTPAGRFPHALPPRPLATVRALCGLIPYAVHHGLTYQDLQLYAAFVPRPFSGPRCTCLYLHVAHWIRNACGYAFATTRFKHDARTACLGFWRYNYHHGSCGSPVVRLLGHRSSGLQHDTARCAAGRHTAVHHRLCRTIYCNAHTDTQRHNLILVWHGAATTLVHLTVCTLCLTTDTWFLPVPLGRAYHRVPVPHSANGNKKDYLQFWWATQRRSGAAGCSHADTHLLPYTLTGWTVDGCCTGDSGSLFGFAVVRFALHAAQPARCYRVGSWWVLAPYLPYRFTRWLDGYHAPSPVRHHRP